MSLPKPKVKSPQLPYLTRPASYLEDQGGASTVLSRALLPSAPNVPSGSLTRTGSTLPSLLGGVN